MRFKVLVVFNLMLGLCYACWFLVLVMRGWLNLDAGVSMEMCLFFIL